MTSVKCRGDFVDIDDGKHRIFVHRSQVILALVPEENIVVVGVVNNDKPIIAKPDNGASANALFTMLSEEIAGGTR